MTGTGRHGVSRMASSVRDINNPAVAAAVVFGLRLLHSSLKRSKLDWNDGTIKSMADPYVGLLTRCVKRSTSDEVVLLAIRSLGFLLRWQLPSIPENRRILATSSLLILTKAGIGGSKDEVTQGIFKIMTLLMKEVDGDGSSALLLKEKQWRALIALLHGMVADTAHHVATFALINVILKKKVAVCVELYELVESLQDLTVTASKDQVRVASRTAFSTFLLNYPLGEKVRRIRCTRLGGTGMMLTITQRSQSQKVDEHLSKVIKNIGYEYDDGRASAITLVAHLCRVLPKEVVGAKSFEKFLLPLALQLTNDTSTTCKEGLALALTNLMGRATKEKLGETYKTFMSWVDGGDATRGLGLQLLGIIADSRRDWVKGRENVIRDVFIGNLEAVQEETDGKIRWKEDWQCAYFSLNGLAKLDLGGVDDLVVSALSHYHPWVKKAAGEIVSTSRFEQGQWYSVVKGFTSHLDCDVKFVNDDIVVQAIKAIVKIAPSLEAGGEEGGRVLKWLFARLGGAAKKSAGGNRMNVYKTFAGLISVLDDVSNFATLILASVHRAISEAEATGNASPDDVSFMKEILVLVEDKVGVEAFMGLYADVQSKAAAKREERKSLIATEKVADPVAAAKRREAKKDKEEGRKRRRMDEKKRGGWKGKKRGRM